MKKRLLSLFLALTLIVGLLSMNAVQADAAEIPNGAPFTSIITDAGEVTGIEDKGTVTYTGYNTYGDVPYYHITIPAGAKEVYVTHPSSEDPFADANYGSAYGYYAETEGWTGKGMSFEVEVAADGYKITLPLSCSVTDWSTSETSELSFVADEDGSVSYAVAVERSDVNDYSPIAFFTFEYAAAEEHTCVFEGWTQTKAPTCTEVGEETGTCSCGKKETREVAATGHSYTGGTCSICGATQEPARKFTKILADANEITNIVFQGIFKLGDSFDGDDDGYNYIHEVPYYIVEVPLGTESVDIVYNADTDVMDSGSNAYGYRTCFEVDAISSATVKSTTFKGGYTLNEDGTQTVRTSVKDNTVRSGERWAITLEENDSPFAAVTLFSFDYPEHTCDDQKIVTEPTCTKDGYTTHTCSQCFANYTDNPVKASGHSYNSVVTAPTCTEEGYTTYTCSVCGDNYTDNEVAASGHTEDKSVETVVVEATCTTDGSATYKCSVCEEEYSELIPKTGHSITDVVVPATCKEQGYTLHKCSNCNYEVKDTYTTELAAHSYTNGTCTVCGAPEAVEGVYQLSTEAHLRWFEEFVEAGNTGVNAKLLNNITVNGSWDGIGTSSKRFAGTFDGNGKTISFEPDNSISATNGLFAYVKGSESNCAVIKDVTVAGTVTSTSDYVAGIAGVVLHVNITGCVNEANVKGNSYVGGIVGNGPSVTTPGILHISECGNRGNISGNSGYVAGILGRACNYANISKCYNSGTIYSKMSSSYSASGVGGIAGYIQNNSTITDCYNTGKVSVDSGSVIGGIVGSQYNGVTVTNCYNIGECKYAIAGSLYNYTSKVSNTYYLAASSELATHANYKQGSSGAVDTATVFIVEPKTSQEMSSVGFAELLGNAYQASCPSPVFTTQTAEEHTGMEDNVCDVCKYGSDEKETYTVTFTTGTGYAFTGEATVEQGADYTFHVTISDGYMKGADFAVIATGHEVTAGDNDTYTVSNVASNMTISVSGVVKAEFKVTIPEFGNGYAVVAESGYTTTVNKGSDFKFTVDIKTNFQKGSAFAVKANGTKLTEVGGVYTIANVMEAQTITVEDVEMIPYADTVDVNFTITKGTTQFYEAEGTDEIMVSQDMKVPYFDLELYGLQKFYYNPYCYLDADGKEVTQSAGTKETAYGVVTAMHAFIYATDIYYLGYDEVQAGTGASYKADTDGDGKSDFEEAISWTQSAGSSFMNLWGHGENLNYYVNYTYPLGKAEWGSTSDQIKLKDGDIFTVHQITSDKGSASGSNFPFFAVNDENGTFDITEQSINYGETVTILDQVDTATVKQGEKIDLTLYLAEPATEYQTAYSKQAGKILYHNMDGELIAEMVTLNGEARWTETSYVTDTNGKVTIDTSNLEPGIHYFGASGGMTAGGLDMGDGYTTKGGETGVAVFKLVVEAPEVQEVPFTVTYNKTELELVSKGKITIDSTREGGMGMLLEDLQAYEAIIPAAVWDLAAENETNAGSAEDLDCALTVTTVSNTESIIAATLLYEDGTLAGGFEGNEYPIITGSFGDIYTLWVDTTPEGECKYALTFVKGEDEAPEVEVVPGDFDGDGEIGVNDITGAIIAYQNQGNLTDAQKAAIDTNGNGLVDLMELTDLIIKYQNK